MGQSISPPTPRQSHSNTRFSTRSLQRSNRSSVNLERQASHSASKVSPTNLDQISKKVQYPTSKAEALEQIKESPQDRDNFTLKRDNLMTIHREIMRGDESVYSPNFKEIPQGDQDYCVNEWKMPIESKRIEKSHSQSHHEITISFSKTKNQYSNQLHEETLVSKENLFKILEDQENSQVDEENYGSSINSTELSAYLKKENEQILTTGLQKRQKEVNNVKSFKKVNKQTIMHENSLLSLEKQTISNLKLDNSSNKQQGNIYTANNSQFNDYGLQHQGRENGISIKRKIRLSKRLQEVKEKIVTVGHKFELKDDFLKSSTLHNLSRSFRSIRGSQLPMAKQDIRSKQNCQEKQQERHQQIVKKGQIQYQQASKAQKFERREFLSPLSQKNTCSSNNKSSHLIIFNGSNAYCYPNALKNVIPIDNDPKLSNSHGTESSISQLIKNSGIKLPQNVQSSDGSPKDSIDLKKNFNRNAQAVYQPVEGEQYDLIGIKSAKKSKLKSPKFEDIRRNVLFIEQNKAKERPAQQRYAKIHPSKLPDPKIFVKIPNKDMMSDTKRRYKSIESKSTLKMKLLVF